MQSDHLKVTPKFDLGVYNDEEDVQVFGVVTTRRVVPKCWEARATRVMGLAQTLVTCCNVVLVRTGRGVIYSEWATAWDEVFGM